MNILRGYFGGGSAPAMMVVILALFVALVLPNIGVLAQDDGEGEEFDMFDALPGCLTEESYFETFRCVVEGVAPDCFEDNSVSTIRECFEDELNTTDLEASDLTGTKEQLEDAAEECFAPYVSCFNETLNAAIDAINSLHPCINETMTNLMVCGYENHETCAAACANAEVNDTAFDDVDYLDLLTCDGVQTNIMDEVCATASCCPECVPEIELWAECVVNDVLDYMDEDCDFTCSVGDESSARKLKAAASAAAAAAANKNNDKKKRELQGGGQGGQGGGGGEMPDVIDLPGAVRECMALIPGIHGGTNETELASRASFFECALEAFVEVIEDAADGDVLLGPDGPPGGGRGGGGGGGGSAGGGRDPPGDGPGGPDGDGTSENGEGKDKGPDGDGEGEGGGFGVSNTNATDENGDTSDGFASNNRAAALVATLAVAVAGLFF